MGKKVKCVVWDLDNTVWEGILSEDRDVKLKSGIKDILRILDERGILQSVASKNEYDDAIKKLQEFGIDEYFLYPQISWNSKAESVRAVAEAINIGIDTLAFVDDQITEREEVGFSYPEVLLIDALKYMEIPQMEELTPPTT
jgi:FkbH-like protein